MNLLNNSIHRNVRTLAGCTTLNFNRAVRKATLTNNHLEREAHEVVIGKLDTRTLAAVVKDNVETAGGKLVRKLLSAIERLSLFVERDDRDS